LWSIQLFLQDNSPNGSARGVVMTAKRSCRALALLLALPSAAFALGLGDVRLLSPLNAPLEAEIEVTDVAPDEINTVQARLASRDAFSQLGLDYPTYLTSVQLRLVQSGDGREVIRVKSADAITDPFITLLIQVTWSHGQLMREYTMLLDPPVYTPGQPAVASAPVSAPSTQADARRNDRARNRSSRDRRAARGARGARGGKRNTGARRRRDQRIQRFGNRECSPGGERQSRTASRDRRRRRAGRQHDTPRPQGRDTFRDRTRGVGLEQHQCAHTQLDAGDLSGQPSRLRPEHERAALGHGTAHS
jgi:hypothetical protein